LITLQRDLAKKSAEMEWSNAEIRKLNQELYQDITERQQIEATFDRPTISWRRSTTRAKTLAAQAEMANVG